MLYLAEVKKQKKGFLGGLTTELKLLAFERNDQRWSVVFEEETIPAEKAKYFGDGTLVIVNLGRNRQIQGTPELAGMRVVRLLQNFSAILEKSKYQEEKMKEWKQSLSLQIEELHRRNMEVKVRLEQLEQMEEEFRRLKQQGQEIKKIPSCQRLGTVLQQADLVSAVQLELALKNQTQYSWLRIGEIIALRGWLKQETIDFFAEQWTILHDQKREQPLGYYLKEAALLDEEQISKILTEQGKLRLRFGEIAVLKGWLKQTTLDFFLKHLFDEHQSDSPLMKVSDLHELTLTTKDKDSDTFTVEMLFT